MYGELTEDLQRKIYVEPMDISLFESAGFLEGFLLISDRTIVPLRLLLDTAQCSHDSVDSIVYRCRGSGENQVIFRNHVLTQLVKEGHYQFTDENVALRMHDYCDNTLMHKIKDIAEYY